MQSVSSYALSWQVVLVLITRGSSSSIVVQSYNWISSLSLGLQGQQLEKSQARVQRYCSRKKRVKARKPVTCRAKLGL